MGKPHSVVTQLDREFDMAKEHLRDALGASFVAVGDALLEMQEVCRKFGKTAEGREAWKAKTGCETFEQFVKLEFQLAKSRAYQLIEASRVYHRLEESPALLDSALPVNQRQCEWLAKVPPKRLPKVWSQILERYAEKRTETAAEGKNVSPHPPATFIMRFLAKAGILAGETLPTAWTGGKQRTTVRMQRKLGKPIEAIRQWTQIQNWAEKAEKESWTKDERIGMVRMLEDLRENVSSLIESMKEIYPQ